MTKIERDRMPVEVATAMLCDPKSRMTNPMRKAWLSVREEHYSAEQKRKPIEDKLAERFHDTPIDRLSREHSRVAARRRGVQRKYERTERLLAAMPDHPVLRAQQAKLDLLAAHLDLVTDAITTELAFRGGLVKGDIAPNALIGSYPLRCVLAWTRETLKENRTIPARWLRVKIPDHVFSIEITR